MDWSSHAKSFSRHHIFDPAQLAVLCVAVASWLVCVLLRTRPSGSQQLEAQLMDTGGVNDDRAAREYRYNARNAWFEGGAFIAACFVASWGAGVGVSAAADYGTY